MPSFLIIDGVRYSRDRSISESTEELGHPIGYLKTRDPNWTDGPWKIRYRMLDRADPGQQWLTMLEMRQLTGKAESWVIEQVRGGRLDTAMVRGSSIPLFRILDRASVLAETIFVEPEKNMQKSSRKGWHRE